MTIYIQFFGQVYYGTMSVKTGRKLSPFFQKMLDSFMQWDNSRVYIVEIPYQDLGEKS